MTVSPQRLQCFLIRYKHCQQTAYPLHLKGKLGGCSDMTTRLRRDGKLPKAKKLASRNVTPAEEADEASAKRIRR
ncbi:MAG: hypothetical protein ACFCVA_06375 [Gammaproteobacteria bacterium]